MPCQVDRVPLISVGIGQAPDGTELLIVHSRGNNGVGVWRLVSGAGAWDAIAMPRFFSGTHTPRPLHLVLDRTPWAQRSFLTVLIVALAAPCDPLLLQSDGKLVQRMARDTPPDDVKAVTMANVNFMLVHGSVMAGVSHFPGQDPVIQLVRYIVCVTTLWCWSVTHLLFMAYCTFASSRLWVACALAAACHMTPLHCTLSCS